jgi:hypothetical protein
MFPLVGGKTPHGCNAWTRDEAMSEPMKGNVWVDECMDKGKDEYMNERTERSDDLSVTP